MGTIFGLAVAWLACGALVLLCARRPNAGRITFGFLFLVCSLGINGAFAAIDPASGLRGMAHPAPLPGYRDAVEGVVHLFAGREVVFFLLLMAYEFALGVLYLAKGRATTVGIVGGVLFNAGIILVYPLYTTMNIALVVAQLFLLRHDYDTTLIARARMHIHLPHRSARALARR